jgi:hypothetical protein
MIANELRQPIISLSKIKFSITSLRHVAPYPIRQRMPAKKYKVIEWAVPTTTNERHALADRESQSGYKTAPIVKKSLVSVTALKSLWINVFTPTWGRQIKASAFSIPFHNDISAQIHRTEMHGKIDVLEECEFLNNVKGQVLQVIRVEIGKAQRTLGNGLDDLIDREISSAAKHTNGRPEGLQSAVACLGPFIVQVSDKTGGKCSVVELGVLPRHYRASMPRYRFALYLYSTRTAKKVYEYAFRKFFARLARTFNVLRQERMFHAGNPVANSLPNTPAFDRQRWKWVGIVCKAKSHDLRMNVD